ncbi:MAG: AI-2E family transporter [Flavobacteriaceae bacterium]|nr:AI-2E family transporter [Flavobacteriaceae bacterium]
MNSKTIANGILRAILIIVGVILTLYLLFKISTILVYIVLASVISLIGRRLVIFFDIKLKLPNTLAVIITMGLFVGILAFLVSLLVPLLVEQSHNLSRIDVAEVQLELSQLLAQIDLYFSDKGIHLLDKLQKISIFEFFQFGSLSTIFTSVIGFIGRFSIGLLATLFISFFMLKDGAILDNMIFTLVPNEQEKKARKSWNVIKDLLSRYFTGLAAQVTILFILYLILLSVFGVKNALIIALLCALLNLIPYVGPLVELVLILTLTMTSNLGLDFQTQILPTTVYVFIGFIVIQLIDAFVSQPTIYSKSVKSHPLEIFLAILIGGTLFGVIGMVVAVPSYTAIRVILKEFLADNKIVKHLLKTFK